MKCELCNGKVFCKDLCKKCYMKEYYAKPEVKQRIKQHMKEYYAKPEVKQQQKEYKKEYYAKQRTKPVSLNTFVQDFFNHFTKKIKTDKDLTTLAEIYSKNACELSGREQCKLEEMILIEGQKSD